MTRKGILGRKIGMTQVFAENGILIPVTVVEVLPNVVLQKKTVEVDGYEAIQLGVEDKREKRSNKPEKGHASKANTAPKRFVSLVLGNLIVGLGNLFREKGDPLHVLPGLRGLTQHKVELYAVPAGREGVPCPFEDDFLGQALVDHIPQALGCSSSHPAPSASRPEKRRRCAGTAGRY